MARSKQRELRGSAARARDHWTGHWQQVFEEQSASGLTQEEFCRERGISLHVFRNRKYKSRTRGKVGGGRDAAGGARPPGEKEPRRPRFVELVPVGPAPALSGENSGIEVLLRNRHRVRLAKGFDSDTLVRVADLLGGGPSC